MSDQILHGSRRWTIPAGWPGFEEQFDAAIAVLCGYAQNAVRLQQHRDVDRAGAAYFNSLPFEKLGDLHGAVTVVRTTPQGHLRSSLSSLLYYLPAGWATSEGLTVLFEQLWEHAVHEQLSRIWRSPTSFPRSDEFDAELARRAMEMSLPATQWSAPLTPVTVIEALNELVSEHERSKWQLEFAIELGSAVAQSESSPFGRREAKDLKNEFKGGQWTGRLKRLYDLQAVHLNQRVAHIVQYCHFVGWMHVPHPQLTGDRSSKS